jgi:glycosyltransferase involved in cell wall biosynthesis
MGPKVSIIVDSYNYARFIRSAIESALGQTYANTEVIVVDDGSTDGSAQIVRSYSGRAKVICKDNAGQASALNAGFAASSGDVVLFLDSDDVLESDAVERIADVVEEGDAKVHWKIHVIEEDGRRTGRLHPAGELSQGDLREFVLREGPDAYSFPPTSGNAWARKFLGAVMPIPEADYRICADLYLSCLAPLFGNVKWLMQPVSSWRLHGENNSWRQPLEVRMEELARRLELGCDALARICAQRGIRVDPQKWRKGAWCQGVRAALKDIDAAVPAGEAFVLIDNNEWAAGERVCGRRCLRFIEREGEFWGLPEDDEQALAELQRVGKRYVVVASPALWWLEQYPKLGERLRCARKLVENERLLIVDLGG